MATRDLCLLFLYLLLLANGVAARSISADGRLVSGRLDAAEEGVAKAAAAVTRAKMRLMRLMSCFA